MSGWDLLLPAEGTRQRAPVVGSGGELFDSAEAERWRIEQGVARWGPN